MANWTTLKEAIANVIKANGNQEITGQLLQNVLNNIVSSVGENATFVGTATPATNPGVPDGPVFYLAVESGTYANFGGVEIAEDEAVILLWENPVWAKKITGFVTQKKFNELDKAIGQEIILTYDQTSKNVMRGVWDGSTYVQSYSWHTVVVEIENGYSYKTPSNAYLIYSDSQQPELGSSGGTKNRITPGSVVTGNSDVKYIAVSYLNNAEFTCTVVKQSSALTKKVEDNSEAIEHNTEGLSELAEKLGNKQQTVLLDDTSSFINMVWASSDGKFVSSSGFKSFIIPLTKGVTYKFPEGANFYNFSTERPTVNGTGGSTTTMSRTSGGEFTPDSDGFGTLAFLSSSFTSYTYYVYASGIFKSLEDYVRYPLKGKKIVMFGDSIIEGVNVVSGQKRMNVLLADISQATCVNGGIGGSQLGARNDVTSTPSTSVEAYANIDIPNLVYAWANKSWSSVDAAVTYLKSNTSDDNTAIINNLKSIDIADTDIVVIAGGTNDLNSSSFGDSQSDNQKTVRGGIKYIVESLLSIKPTLSIYFFTPLPRITSTLQEPNIPVYSDDYRAGTDGSFLNLVAAIKEEAMLNHIPCGDTYYRLGINQYNIQSYGGAQSGTDYTHLTKCYPRYAQFMYEFIISNATWGE